MQLRTWTPLLELEREMRNAFERYWPAEAGTGAVRLTTDMHREGDKLVVTVEMPGVDPDKDIDVSVEGDTLIIKGEKTAEREVKEEDCYMQERSFGRFERTLMLPDGVDPESVIASFDKGVLTVEVPIPEPKSETRTIPVRTGNGKAKG
ncbi:MAG: Hsp20/alpha crystallin family protein [Actinomycetota bacterium]